MTTTAANSILGSLLIQLCCVLVVAFAVRRSLPVRLNVLLSSAFVTVPVWHYPPLADVGMVFLFDLVVPVLLLRELYLRYFRIGDSQVRSIGILVFVVPALYAPFSYFFVDPSYIPYHSLLLLALLYRSLLIVVAVVILARELRDVEPHAVTRLMALQCLVLFLLGTMQYLAQLDLVVYERLKDVESTVDLLLEGEQKILIGFGFLGLFRGAVPQMAIIALYWWLVATMRWDTKKERMLLSAMCLLGLVCVGGTLSRIGAVSLGIVLIYAACIRRELRVTIGLFLLIGLSVVVSFADLDSLGLDLIKDRFDPDQFTGQEGSGSTRIDSAAKLFEGLKESWMPWLIGLGGFNPIATNEHYGVFGMHGDYMDVLARYGVIAGLAYACMVLVLLLRRLGGFFSDVPLQRALARAFGVLVLGMATLAITQGTLVFSGAAGYLAATHAWLAIAFAGAAQKSHWAIQK